MTRLLITLDGLAYEVELDAVGSDTCRVVVNGEELNAVSYTHLDVYKRQASTTWAVA